MDLLKYFKPVVNLVETMVKDEPLSENDIIKLIHNDFDTAADRLIAEANEILSKGVKQRVTAVVDPELRKKAGRLRAVGFTSAFHSQKIKEIEDLIKTQEQLIRIEKAQLKEKESLAGKIQYYQQSYPFAKFLTVGELDRICDKYGLVHMSVRHYIKDVPDKNLKEIENAQKVYFKDLPDGAFEKDARWGGGVDVVSFNQVIDKIGGRKVTSLLKSLEDIVDLYNRKKNILSFYRVDLSHIGVGMERTLMVAPNPYEEGTQEWDLYDETAKNWEVNKNIGRYYGGRTEDDDEIRVSEKCGFNIAAPSDHFNIKGLVKEGKHGYRIKNDPIVFKYVKDGILVFSKWGLEAGDEALINPVNN